jgi:hypothetical protein
MQRILLLIASLLVCIITFGQAPKFLIDLEVGYLRFKNDSVQFQRPKMFSISTSGCTEIFSLGKSRVYEFGMKVEILASKLTGTEKYLVGKIYYVRNDKGGWQEIMRLQHMELDVRPIAQREKFDMFMMGGASNDHPAFDVRLNDSYYLHQ